MKINYFHNTLRKLAVLIGAAMFTFLNTAFAYDLQEEISLPEGAVEGTLKNGLKYIIMPNNFPDGRVEFRLVWKVGAVQQDDNQGGAAHFLEHMAFGGSRRFPDRGAVAYLESLGMKYGIDINAFTGHDRTIYMFAVPSSSIADGNYKKPLAIIRDWADGLTINPTRVETEKGIILEELRSSFQDDPFYNLKIGQNRFSTRMPLGTPEEVERMTAETLGDYYKKWYIPSLGAIVVVGDVDPLSLERQIKEEFSSLKRRRDPGFRRYPLSYAPPQQIMYEVDSLTIRDEAEIIIPHPTVVTRTLGDLKQKETGNILVSAFGKRLHKRGIHADVSDAWYLGDSNHLVFSVHEGSEIPIDSMILLVASEVGNVLKNGFGTEEISYYAGRAAGRVAATSREGTPSDAWCEDFADYILSGDKYLSMQSQIEAAADIVKDIKAEEVDRLMHQWISYADSTMLITMKTAPERQDTLSLDNLTAAWKRGLERPAEPYEFEMPQEKAFVKIDVPKALEVCRPYNANEIATVREYPKLGIAEFTLRNGIKILMKPTESEGETLFSMLGPGGYSTIPPEKLPLLGGAASYIDMGGLAKCGPELGDFMYQNDMTINTVLENDWHGFLGAFKPAQAKIFANLFYEKITDPELLYEDFEEVRESMLESLGKESLLSRMLNRAADRQLTARMQELMGNTLETPDTSATDDEKLARQRDFINRMNLDSIADFYKELYMNPTGKTIMIFGTFDTDSILRAFVPVLSALGEGHPVAEREYVHKLPEETYIERFPNENESQTEFDLLYFNRYDPGLRNSLVLKLMVNLLRNHVINELREHRALVYSPYVDINYEGIPRGYFFYDINSSCKNSNMKSVRECLYDIIEDLRNVAPDEVELDGIKRACSIARRETLNSYSPSAWRTIMMTLAKNGESLEDFERYDEIIASITPEEILDAFKTKINPDLYVLLYMSDKELEE